MNSKGRKTGFEPGTPMGTENGWREDTNGTANLTQNLAIPEDHKATTKERIEKYDYAHLVT